MYTVTTKDLFEIRRLNQEKYMTDAEISEELGISYGTIRYHRMQLGLPLRKHKYRDCVCKHYSVYNNRAKELVADGTALTCATLLGIQLSSFYSLVTKTRQGRSTKYEVYVIDR